MRYTLKTEEVIMPTPDSPTMLSESGLSLRRALLWLVSADTSGHSKTATSQAALGFTSREMVTDLTQHEFHHLEIQQ